MLLKGTIGDFSKTFVVLKDHLVQTAKLVCALPDIAALICRDASLTPPPE